MYLHNLTTILPTTASALRETQLHDSEPTRSRTTAIQAATQHADELTPANCVS